jgi:hypothetical protein
MCVRVIYMANTEKDCDMLQDRPFLQSGRTPHDRQNLVMNPRGVQCQDGLTDRPTVRQLQSNFDFDSVSCTARTPSCLQVMSHLFLLGYAPKYCRRNYSVILVSLVIYGQRKYVENIIPWFTSTTFQILECILVV